MRQAANPSPRLGPRRKSTPIKRSTARIRGTRPTVPARISRRHVSSTGHRERTGLAAAHRRLHVFITHPSLRRAVAVALPIILFVIALTQCLDDARTTPFHPDEARWLNRAHFITDLKDPFGPTWADYYITRGQPPLGSYLMGIGLLVQGRDTVTNAVWDFAYDADWNAFNDAMPDPKDLLAGRRTNAVVAALVVVAVYLVGTCIAGRFGAFVGALFLSLHPLHIYLGSQALSDQLLSLTLVAAFLAAFWFGKRPTLARAVLLGTLLGLGGATKLSPLLLSVPLASLGAAGIAVQLRHHGRRFWTERGGRLGLLLLVQPLIAFASFVAVSPYLWPNPIGRTYALFEFRRIEMVGQGTNWPSVAVASPTAAIGRIGLRLNENPSTTARLQEILADLLGLTFRPIGFDLLMVCIGGLLLIMTMIDKGILSPHGLVGVLLGSELALIILGMGSDFYRYYLPIVSISALLVSVFGEALLQLVTRLLPRSWLRFRPRMSFAAANDRAHESAGPSTSEVV